MNMFEMSEKLKDFSQDQLVQEMRMPSGSLPQFLVLSELQRRNRMRMEASQAEPRSESTVAEDAVAAAGVPQAGIAGMARALAPKTDVAANDGVRRMAGGGEVTGPATAALERFYAPEGRGAPRSGIPGIGSVPASLGFDSATWADPGPSTLGGARTVREGVEMLGGARGMSRETLDRIRELVAAREGRGSVVPAMRPDRPEAAIMGADALFPSLGLVRQPFLAALDRLAPEINVRGYTGTAEWLAGMEPAERTAATGVSGAAQQALLAYLRNAEGEAERTATITADLAEESAPVTDPDWRPRYEPEPARAPLSGQPDLLGDMSDAVPPPPDAGEAEPAAGRDPTSIFGDLDADEASDRWLALARFGLGLMASRAPNLGAAIGEAGLGAMSEFDAIRDRYNDRRLQQAQLDAEIRIAEIAAASRASGDQFGLDANQLRQGLQEQQAALAEQIMLLGDDRADERLRLAVELRRVTEMLNALLGIPTAPPAAPEVEDVGDDTWLGGLFGR